MTCLPVSAFKSLGCSPLRASCEHTFVTAEAHPQVRFRRAIERRALWLAEDAARELPNLPLEDAPPARPPLRRARLAEVREGCAALARALSD